MSLRRKQRRRYIPRCYESRRQNQEGWSSLHAHFEPATLRFVSLAHKQKYFLPCRARECAQNIFNSFETAEGGLGAAGQRGWSYLKARVRMGPRTASKRT